MNGKDYRIERSWRKMNRANKILSDVTVHMKYAKYEEEKQRRETRKHITTNPTAHSHELPPPKPNAFHHNFISKNEIQTQRAITKKNIDFQK